MFASVVVNPPGNSQAGNKQNKRQVRHENARTQKLKLTHEKCKARET